LVLEAVLPGMAEGSVVSIGRPTGADNQVWVVARKKGNTHALGSKANPRLVLAAETGGTNNGTPMVMETDRGQPWQRWSFKANASGTLSLLAAHAPTKGLDDFGGGATPGSRQDLWDYRPGDEHLEWVLKPLAGATVPARSSLPIPPPTRCISSGWMAKSPRS
jgi:gluconolactonase